MSDVSDPVVELGAQLGGVVPIEAAGLEQELRDFVAGAIADCAELSDWSLDEEPQPTIAASVMPMLRLTIGLEAAAGDTVRADTLRRHYLHWMPALWVEQVGSRRFPFDALFHTPLDWERLPRLRGALQRLFGLLAQAGVTGPVVAGAASFEAFAASHTTVASIYDGCHFGRWMPLLYGYPADLASYGAEITAGADPLEVIDRRITAPLLHDLLHFSPGRRCIFPPYLDECIAGGLGVIVLPSLAWPEGDDDHGLMGASWFAQVGMVMVAVLGLEPLLRAQAGALPWSELLGEPLAAACARLGWGRYLADHAVHFLSGNTRPDAWLSLLYAHAAGVDLTGLDADTLEGLDVDPASVPSTPLDRDLVEAGLRSMCVETTQLQGSYRVRTAVPPVPITVDLADWTLRRARLPPHEPAAPTWPFPPALVALHRAAGHAAAEVVLTDVAGIADATDALLDGRDAAAAWGHVRWRPA